MSYKASHLHEQTFGYYAFQEGGIFNLLTRMAREHAERLKTAGGKQIEHVSASAFRKSTGYEGRPKRLPPDSPCLCSKPTSSHIHIEIRLRAKGVNLVTAKALAGAAAASGLL